jgi:hypothetical protein
MQPRHRTIRLRLSVEQPSLVEAPLAIPETVVSEEVNGRYSKHGNKYGKNKKRRKDSWFDDSDDDKDAKDGRDTKDGKSGKGVKDDKKKKEEEEDLEFLEIAVSRTDHVEPI